MEVDLFTILDPFGSISLSFKSCALPLSLLFQFDLDCSVSFTCNVYSSIFSSNILSDFLPPSQRCCLSSTLLLWSSEHSDTSTVLILQLPSMVHSFVSPWKIVSFWQQSSYLQGHSPCTSHYNPNSSINICWENKRKLNSERREVTACL